MTATEGRAEAMAGEGIADELEPMPPELQPMARRAAARGHARSISLGR